MSVEDMAAWRSQMINRQAMPSNPKDRVEGSLGIESMMVANTQQMRHLAASARRWNFPYQLDFRTNTLLDAGGLHTVLFDAMLTGDSPDTDMGGNLFLRCLCWFKLVGCTANDAMGGFLTIRFRDYLWLQYPEGEDEVPFNIAQARAVLPRDEYTPDPPDPRMVTWERGNRPLPPGARAAYRFKPGNEPQPRYLGDIPPRYVGDTSRWYGEAPPLSTTDDLPSILRGKR